MEWLTSKVHPQLMVFPAVGLENCRLVYEHNVVNDELFKAKLSIAL